MVINILWLNTQVCFSIQYLNMFVSSTKHAKILNYKLEHIEPFTHKIGFNIFIRGSDQNL